jgi:DNA-directed RNA polymerase alpha subunit
VCKRSSSAFHFVLHSRVGGTRVSMTTPVRDLKITLPNRFPDELPIEEVGLDTRLLRALVNEGLKTVGDVRDMSDVELRCVRRIGNRSFRVLRNLFGPSRSINARDFDREEAR